MGGFAPRSEQERGDCASSGRIWGAALPGWDGAGLPSMEAPTARRVGTGVRVGAWCQGGAHGWMGSGGDGDKNPKPIRKEKK